MVSPSAVGGAGVAVGLLLTPERRAFFSKWIWLGFAIAMLIWLPNVIWNIHNHWPFLELMRNIRASGRDLPFTPLGYIRAQIFLMTPVTFPVWLLGGLYFFLWQEGKPFRLLGWAFISVLVVFIVVGCCNAANLMNGLDGLCGGRLLRLDRL